MKNEQNNCQKIYQNSQKMLKNMKIYSKYKRKLWKIDESGRMKTEKMYYKNKKFTKRWMWKLIKNIRKNCEKILKKKQENWKKFTEIHENVLNNVKIDIKFKKKNCKKMKIDPKNWQNFFKKQKHICRGVEKCVNNASHYPFSALSTLC